MSESHNSASTAPTETTQSGDTAKLFGVYLLIYPVLLFGGLALLGGWLYFWLWILDGLPAQPGIALIMAFGLPAWFVWSFHKIKIERVEQAPVGQLRHFSAQRGKEKLDHSQDGLHIVPLHPRYDYDAVCQVLGSRGEKIPLGAAGAWIPLNRGTPECYRWRDREGHALTAVFFSSITRDWWVSAPEELPADKGEAPDGKPKDASL